MTDLLIQLCQYKLARYACEHYHYSKKMPAGKMIHYGIYEDGQFFGVVIFGWGANRNIGKPYNMTNQECVELQRVALKAGHVSATSQIVSACVRQLKKDNPLLKLIVSYADDAQGHVGTIYQAMNWVYVGEWNVQSSLVDNNTGEKFHQRTLTGQGKDLSNYRYEGSVKRKYLYPLDKPTRKVIMLLAKPYPKKGNNS